MTEHVAGRAERNCKDYEGKLVSDIEKAICLSLDTFENLYGPLSQIHVTDVNISQLDVKLYVIMQSQWYLRQIRDQFMGRSEKSHKHSGDPCFVCAHSDMFVARTIAFRHVLEDDNAVNSSSKLCPACDFLEEWTENQVNKAIDISSSAHQLKQQLIDLVRKVVTDLDNEREDKSEGAIDDSNESESSSSDDESHEEESIVSDDESQEEESTSSDDESQEEESTSSDDESQEEESTSSVDESQEEESTSSVKVLELEKLCRALQGLLNQHGRRNGCGI